MNIRPLKIIPISLFACLSAIAGTLSAQALSINIPYRVACTTCSIVFDSLVTLGNSRDPVLIAKAAVYRDSRGRYYTAATDFTSTVVFDSVGRFMRTIGKQGDGPGEFGRRIRRIQLSGDSLVIFGDSRTVVYSPNYSVARSMALMPGLSPVPSAAFLKNGGVVLSGNARMPASIGFPFHLVDPSGKASMSFGTREAVAANRQITSFAGARKNFALTPSRDQIWAWADYEYRGELWSISTGRKLQDLKVTNVSWLPATAPSVDWGPLTQAFNSGAPLPIPPMPSGNISQVDAQNRLWVLAIVPFKIGERLSGKFAECAKKPESETKGWRYCHLLEVIDPVSRTVLASQFVATDILNVAGTDLYFHGFEDASDIPHVTVWRARLVSQPGGRH